MKHTELYVYYGVTTAPINLSVVQNSSNVTLYWLAPLNNGGYPITSYTVSVTPGNYSVTTSSKNATFTNLSSNLYTFSVVAKNFFGNSPSSSKSYLVQLLAPTSLVATGSGSTSVSIAFQQTSNGTITNYQYSLDGGNTFTSFSPSQTSSPVLITGLSTDTTYSIVLRAANSAGNGLSSSPRVLHTVL